MRVFHSATLLFLASCLLSAREPEYNHVFFENSLMEESWFYSQATYRSPSFITNIQGRLPLDDDIFFTPGNSLELSYVSAPFGSWKVQLDFPRWRGMDLIKSGRSLCLSLFVRDDTQVAELPAIAVILRDKLISGFVPLGTYLNEYIPGKWIRASIPLEEFSEGKVDMDKRDSREIVSVLFKQDASDGNQHRILIDQVEIMPPPPAGSGVQTPEIKSIRAYERHVDLSWDPVDPERVKYVKIYCSEEGAEYIPVGIQSPERSNRFEHFTAECGRQYSYRISALNYSYEESGLSPPAEAVTHEMSDSALLDMVQEACFRYYWEGAEESSGLALENIPGRKNMIATGASGFGIMALLAGAERGFIDRSDLVARLERIVAFIEEADRFHGALPHFLDGPTGGVVPYFGKYDDGGDLVETSFFIQGLLCARQYLSREVPEENSLRQRITAIWKGVEWDWYMQYTGSPFLYWHWSPDYAWHINHPLIGWNETMITYILAICSLSHPVPPDMYYTGWASRDKRAREYRSAWGKTSAGSMYSNGETYYGVRLDVGVSDGGPLFFTHYSYMGFDPHAFSDRYTEYFRNNRNIALINYRYCCENPENHQGYGENCWGLTASDGPWGYKAREPVTRMDDGTIAPTGSLSSFPYLPEESMKALKYYYRDCGSFLWGEYGFRDAFNLDEDWCANIYMGLNQAPIVVMIENYRTGLLWRLFMSSPEIKLGLAELESLKE